VKFKDYGIIKDPSKIPDVYLDNEVHVGWIPKHNVIYIYFKTKDDLIEYQIWRDKTVRQYVERAKKEFLIDLDNEKRDIYDAFFDEIID
jgi:hypothetical protein